MHQHHFACYTLDTSGFVRTYTATSYRHKCSTSMHIMETQFLYSMSKFGLSLSTLRTLLAFNAPALASSAPKQAPTLRILSPAVIEEKQTTRRRTSNCHMPRRSTCRRPILGGCFSSIDCGTLCDHTQHHAPHGRVAVSAALPQHC